MTKKGLYKLVTRPHVFVRDYLRKRSYLLTIPFISQKNIELNQVNKKVDCKPMLDKFNISFLLNRIQISGLYIEPLSILDNYTIAIREEDKTLFFNHLVKILFEENISIEYMLNKNIKKPNSILDLWMDISKKSSLDIKLFTKRKIEDNYFSFRLEFLEEFSDYYLFPRNNHISRRLYKSTVSEYNLFDKDKLINYNIILNYSNENEIDFSVDLVFTWVNSEDEEWQELYRNYKQENGESNTDSVSISRFLNRDELKYSLRSWDMYGKFINKIYIVSNCKAPEWLDLENESIVWVNHEEIMPSNILPTFSSHAIETSLHKIKGLSNFFIYSNDDVFLLRPSDAHDFYYPNGIVKLKLEPYGNVNGNVKEGDPDYLNAARNVTKLLEKKFHKTPTHLHTHSSQAMRVDILKEMERIYFKDFQRTLSNRFRTKNDISVASYMYPHYALLLGKAINTKIKVAFVQQKHDFNKRLQELLQLKSSQQWKELPLSVCLNDGADSHLNEEWNNSVLHFLESYFPNKSSYEL